MKNIFYVLIILLISGVIGVALYLQGDTPDRKRDSKGELTGAKALRYVALGDSVASGLGAGLETDASGCGRTETAYPYVFSKLRGYKLTHLACSGARINEGLRLEQVTGSGPQRPQLDELFEAKPDIVTLSIGANDVQWLSLLAKCYQAECATEEDKKVYAQYLAEYREQLKTTLSNLQDQMGTDTKLILVGYYQVFPSSGTCSDITGLDERELAWGRALRSELNQFMKDAAKTTGYGKYVEINFGGHELCSSEPWIQGLSDPAAYHANAAGHAAIANQIHRALNED